MIPSPQEAGITALPLPRTPAASRTSDERTGGALDMPQRVTEEGRVPLRILLADDHPVYCDGLSEAVSARDELELVAVATDGGQAISLVREHLPDVAVLDVKMPDMSGLDVAAAILREGLPTRTLLLSAFDDEEIIVRAVSLGVGGYMLKDASRVAICDAMVAVAEGRVILAPEAQAAVAMGLRARRAPPMIITAREREILQLTADGMSAAAVGKALFLSPATVKTHLRRIYEKLGVSERAAAVAVAMRMGILE